MKVILGIESSCDETGIALVGDGHTILDQVISSQIDIHKPFGGVVPEIASRQHTERIAQLVDHIARQTPYPLAGVAATKGPGLMGSLMVGLNFAKAFAWARNIPFIPVHHIEGHLYSAFIDGSPPVFPFLALIVSGGHTQLIHCLDHHDYELLATTRDDAVGESFDKVARLLGLPYPGGPSVSKAAENGNPQAYNFPRAFSGKEEMAFSYSGLKTSVLYTLRDQPDAPAPDIAASFQWAAIDILVEKTKQALKTTHAPRLVVAGGVAANQLLRQRLQSEVDVHVHIPPVSLCTDNGAMIAAAGYWRLLHGYEGNLKTTARATWPLAKSVA